MAYPPLLSDMRRSAEWPDQTVRSHVGLRTVDMGTVLAPARAAWNPSNDLKLQGFFAFSACD
jgi:hypothetical protein